MKINDKVYEANVLEFSKIEPTVCFTGKDGKTLTFNMNTWEPTGDLEPPEAASIFVNSITIKGKTFTDRIKELEDERSLWKAKLFALCYGLEMQNVQELMSLTPESINDIAKAMSNKIERLVKR